MGAGLVSTHDQFILVSFVIAIGHGLDGGHGFGGHGNGAGGRFFAGHSTG